MHLPESKATEVQSSPNQPLERPLQQEPAEVKLSVVNVSRAEPPGPGSDKRRLLLLRPLALVLAAFTGCWALIFILYPPRSQRFPLLDDWACTRGLIQLAHGGGVDYFNWANAPHLGQWLWAMPFACAFGFSWPGLRLSTIVLSSIGVAAFYDLLRQEGCDRRRAAFLAATLALSPLYFVLSGTFTCEIPTLAFCLLALTLYRRAIASQRAAPLAAAAVVAVLAVITNQNALAVPIGAACMLLMRGGTLRGNPRWQVSLLLPLILGLTTAIWFEAWPSARPVNPAPMPPTLAVLLPYWTFHLCGLAALPALALVPPERLWKRFVIGLGLMGVFAIYWAKLPGVPNRGLFPYGLTAVFSRAGIGQPTLHVGEKPPLLDESIQSALTNLGCIAGAALIVRLSQQRSPQFWHNPILVFTAIQAAFVVIRPAVYDRDFLFLIPGAIFLAGAPPAGARVRWLPGMVCLLVFAALSICLIHDWFASNHALWTLGRRAVEQQHVDPMQIEGGFEWDGWHAEGARRITRNPFKTMLPKRLATPALTLYATHQIFPQVVGNYALAFSRPPRCTVVDSEPYGLWLIRGGYSVLLVKYAPPMTTTAAQKSK